MTAVAPEELMGSMTVLHVDHESNAMFEEERRV
jgi:hypothetical protein